MIRCGCRLLNIEQSVDFTHHIGCELRSSVGMDFVRQAYPAKYLKQCFSYCTCADVLQWNCLGKTGTHINIVVNMYLCPSSARDV